MRFKFFRRKPVATERLLALREEAGADPLKNDRYHQMVNRYQRVILKAYDFKNKIPFFGKIIKNHHKNK